MYWGYYYTTLTVGIILTAVFLVLRVKKGGLVGVFSKTAASLCFIATGFAAANQKSTYHEFTTFMIFGFIMGMLGDIWLDLKWVYFKDNDSFLHAGFICFMVGHLSFLTAIMNSAPWTWASNLVAFAAALAIALVATLLEKPLKVKYGKFKKIVFLYSFVLSLVFTTSLSLAFFNDFQPVWVATSIGSGLFLLSDLVLSGTYFGEGKNTPFYVVLNHLLYYGAQFTLASAIHFIK